MGLHYPFTTLDLPRYAAAGFGLAERSRTLTAPEVLRSWPLVWVPQVRMTSPAHCLHPDDRLRLTGNGLAGEVFAVHGDAILVELDNVAEPRDRIVSGNVVEVDLRDPALPRYVNSSLPAYARCHLAWFRALTASWETHLAVTSTSNAEIAERFAARVAEIDGGSPFWADRAFEIEDLGPNTSATHEWLVGRAGLPDV